MKQKEDLKVVFRKWDKEHGNGIIALFPEVPGDLYGIYCLSYEHIGQHAVASTEIVQVSTSATPEEYKDLLEELANIYPDYNLVVKKRISSAMDRKRYDNAVLAQAEDDSVDEPEPYFDRFDICEAHYVLENDYNVGGWLYERPSNQRRRMSTGAQLHRMGFKPSPLLGGYDDLQENGKAIYRELVKRYNLPWGGEDAR